ncbi:MAG: hypothetical protein N0E58_15805 [Candidatus Thiodiazotropha endolucinida]|uniref:Uncharacterized protein n=1 Tax=Candidatus Thiodiazotropha taylori TaxID=2792791 RepID=A0A9E4NLQ2_9GAMM|nr:hypothetical protein [Candidatus Thiodiazotropha taylori]MCW4237712.1 hypothetical protein [Candidatus Thiodiazotropha endolucinida]
MKDKSYYHSIPLFAALGWFGAKHDFLVETFVVCIFSLVIYLYVNNTKSEDKK